MMTGVWVHMEKMLVGMNGRQYLTIIIKDVLIPQFWGFWQHTTASSSVCARWRDDCVTTVFVIQTSLHVLLLTVQFKLNCKDRVCCACEQSIHSKCCKMWYLPKHKCIDFIYQHLSHVFLAISKLTQVTLWCMGGFGGTGSPFPGSAIPRGRGMGVLREKFTTLHSHNASWIG